MRLHHESPYVDLLEDGALVDSALVSWADPGAHRPEDRTLATLALEALAPPESYASRGVQYVTHVPTIGAHRDSDALARSNLEVAAEELAPFAEVSSISEELAPDDYQDANGDVPDLVRGSAGHWAVGWVESLDVRPFGRGADGRWYITEAWRAVCELRDALEEYPVLDEMHYSELEHEELAEYVASEVGDDLDGPWTTEVLEHLYADGQVSRAEDLRTDHLEELYYLMYAERAAEVLERFRAWHRLREVGDGQLTFDGETVRVPAPPSPEELEALTVDGCQLPGGLERVAEDSDTEREIREALELLRSAPVPA